MRKFIPTLLILLLCCSLVMAQDNEPTPYEIALQRIEEARITGATSLNLYNLGLETVPPEIGTLVDLSSLDLSNNRLSSLPIEIANLINLHSVDLRNNRFTNFPMELIPLENLGELFLSNNQLRNLPSEIQNLRSLQRLYLGNNQLSSLPPEIVYLPYLCYLDLSDNQFRTLPSQLAEIEGLWDANCFSDNQHNLVIRNNPLISPPEEIISQETAVVLQYLRNEAWWHFQRLIAGGASFTGILAAAILGIRWRNRRRKGKKREIRVRL